ncbi:penicillin-binding protein 1A [Agrobacterium rubi]|nr:penicillin-binding protein 1A [Agrobacterium rubi]NTF24352.1 penicillin-binding protein 1A [Agrobacterium rubi]
MALARTFLSGVALTAAAVSIAAVSVAVAYVGRISPDLPSHIAVSDWKAREGTTILASDGSVLGVHAREFRKFVSLDAMPPLVSQAFVAAEDGSYWHHKGVDPKAIARAALANLRGGTGRVEGGSTITQQVVKNLVLSPERTFDRKAKEALLALRIDKEVGKRRVLEIYLNEIYLGAGAYGVAAAAEVYFRKPLSELTIGEVATLAGLPQAPSAANPFTRPAKALERRNYVLDRMAAEGFAEQSAVDAAKAAPLSVAPRADSAPGTAGPAFWYPEESVRRMLVQTFGSDRIYGEGGIVRTPIRPTLQRTVHRELRSGLVAEDRLSGWRGPLARRIPLPADWNSSGLTPPQGAEDWVVGVVADAGRDARVSTRDGDVVIKGSDLSWATSSRKASAILSKGDAILLGDLGRGMELVQIPTVQGAVVIMDPASGDILALDGGFSHEVSEFNRATQAQRQTGSVFKSFVYLAATERGYDAMSPVLDSPIALSQGPGLADWRPQNGEKGMGLITLRRAAELSRNMATVRVLYDVGEDAVASVASRAGFKLPERLNWAMALGAAETTPLDVATAYSTLANGGYRVEPKFYVDENAPPLRPTDRVFDPIPVAQVSSMLEGVVHHGTARRAFEGFDLPLAAKTGTTNDARDAWFAAYGPRFVAIAWVGRDDHRPLSKASSGGGTVAPIMRRILDSASVSGDLQFDQFTLPDGADTVLADRETGLTSDDGDVLEIVRETPASDDMKKAGSTPPDAVAIDDAAEIGGQ